MMTAEQIKEVLMPVVEAIAERFRKLETRVTALEPEPTTWPVIEPEMLKGD